MSSDTKTTADVLAERVLDGSADIEAAKHIAERTGIPVLLDAFRTLGYTVSRVENPQPTEEEAERQRRFGDEAIELLQSLAGEVPAPTTFQKRKVRQIFEKAISGNVGAARELSDLAEGPPGWRIERGVDPRG